MISFDETILINFNTPSSDLEKLCAFQQIRRFKPVCQMYDRPNRIFCTRALNETEDEIKSVVRLNLPGECKFTWKLENKRDLRFSSAYHLKQNVVNDQNKIGLEKV